MPSLHFSYLRETWPNFPTVNICDVKPAESMSLSGLILAGFYEIAARSQSSAQIPSTWDLHYPGRLALSGMWGTDPQALYSRVGAETSGVGVAAENSGQNQRRTRNFQQCPLSKNHARNIPSLPVPAVSEQSIHSLLLMSSVSTRKKLPAPAGRSRVLGLNVPAWRSRPQSVWNSAMAFHLSPLPVAPPSLATSTPSASFLTTSSYTYCPGLCVSPSFNDHPKSNFKTWLLRAHTAFARNVSTERGGAEDRHLG